MRLQRATIGVGLCAKLILKLKTTNDSVNFYKSLVKINKLPAYKDAG